MALFNQRKIILDTSGIEQKLDRLNYLFEQFLIANNISIDGPPTVFEEVDADDYSSVLYSDEQQELVDQHLAKRIGGVQIG